MKTMVLFLAILLNLFIPIVMILVLLRKQQLRKKFIFFGFLQYGIGKVLLTLLNLFCRNVNMPNLLADTGVQVLLLAILAVGTKYILYSRCYHITSETDALSAGFGEATMEIFLHILPIAFNNLMYQALIANGSIYQSVGAALSEAQVLAFIKQFTNYDLSYFLYTGLVCIILMMIHMLSAVMIFHKIALIVPFLTTFALFSVYYVIPLFSYTVCNAVIFMLVCVYLVFMYQRKKIAIKKNAYL